MVLVVDTFHHIGNRAAYFAGVRKSLRPGGRVAIIDFRKDAPGDGPPAHFRFTPEQISAEMDAAGFTLDARHDFLPPAALPRLSQQVIPGDRAIVKAPARMGLHRDHPVTIRAMAGLIP